MAFTALKPCSFGGQGFRIGDTVPDGLVRPEMVKRLTEMGKIAELPECEPAAVPVAVPEPDTSKTVRTSRARGTGGE